MHPQLFTIPFLNLPVHSYGLMLVLGLLCAMEVAKFLARRSGLNPDLFSTAAILALVFGLIGARIAYVIQFHDDQDFNTGNIGTNLFNIINLTSGGLVYYGGFLLATAGLIIWAIWKKVPLLRGMDIVAPCLMIGLAFGRVGCFLNGCCWGQHCELDSVVAVRFPYYSPPYNEDVREGKVHPDERLLDTNGRLMTPEKIAKRKELAEIVAAERSLPVINTQLISTATASLIALICLCVFTLYLAPGRGFAVMLMLEGISRTLIEGLRVEPTVLGPFTLSMVIGLVVCASGVVLWFAAAALRNRPIIGDTPGYPAVPATSPIAAA